MRLMKTDSFALCLVLFLTSCGFASETQTQAVKIPDTAQGRAERTRLIQEATSWLGITPAQVSSRDIIGGPAEAADFAPRQLQGGVLAFKNLTCQFVRPDDADYEAQGGMTPKFLCRLPGVKKPIKIKYFNPGETLGNAEVFTEVAAGRLFWALGFPADYVQPVSVNCIGCPQDPWSFVHTVQPGDAALTALDNNRMQRFSYAAVEIKYQKEKIKMVDSDTKADVLEGWTFDEALNSAGVSLEERINRQMIAALNTMLFNYDVKADNQRLVCAEEGENGRCKKAELVVHDPGFSFGGDLVDPFRRKLHFEAWKSLAVFRDAPTCNMSHRILSFGIQLNLRRAAQEKLLSLLDRLTEQQRVDIFRVSRFGAFRGAAPASYGDRPVSYQQFDDVARAWAEVFSAKVDRLKSVTCPE